MEEENQSLSQKEVYEILKAHKFLEYGAHISGKQFRDICGIESIEIGTQNEFNRIALAELGYAGYIRNILLNEGKYFKGERDDYRVLLPSENAEQVLSYMNSADNKLKRGLKLNRNTPVKFKINSNDEVRAILKQESIKNK